METNAELLKRIQELEAENAKLKENHKKELQKKDLEIYKINIELEKALLVIQNYEEKYNIERTRIFIPKTEKLENIVINETEEVIKQKATNKGKKYNKKSFDYESHVTEVRYIEPKEKICPKCGEKLITVSEKVRYLVEVKPAQIKVVKIIKRSMKCPDCNKSDNKIYYPLVQENINGSILSSSLAAYIAYHKYELGIPFEHLAKHITDNVGFDITKQDLANYMARVANLIEPIYSKMLNDLLNNSSQVIHSDETTLSVSKRDEENKGRKKSYVYVYTSSFYDKKRIRIYDFHESRSINQTAKWLESYSGVIECDNYSGYNTLKKLNNNIKLQKCWAHVRRRYADIVKNLSEKDKKQSKAYQILEQIKQLFHLESIYKKERLIPDEIVKRRKNDIPSIKSKIEKLIFESNPLKGSALDVAINYTKECWNDLFTFMDNGYVEISNNIAEQAVKPFVVQRKVFQTSGSYAGARYTSKLFSLVQTCKINNIKVEKYFKYLIENINRLPIDELLPYSDKISEKIK